MPRRPRILVSACLLGVRCRYDGRAQPCPAALRLADVAELIPICPEQLGGLPTPRIPAERRGDRVVTREGGDVTEAFRRGAEQTCLLAEALGAKYALLKARSPSCGSGGIYDGSFAGRIVQGNGVAAEALAGRGVQVFSEGEIDALLARLRAEQGERSVSMEKNYRAELVGVLGDPVDGNPTGVMEEAAFAAAGLNWRYMTVRVLPGELDDAMRGVKAFHMKGVNLTMPHKIDVLKYMDELSEAARVIGAVNTVVCREDGTLFGENTDGKGFVQSLTEAGIPLKGAWVTILGAGGAARAIGVECALAGAMTIDIINRSAARGEALADVINARTPADAEYLPWNGTAEIRDETDILINATCVGLHPDVTACPDIDFDVIRPDMAVCDVVFNPVDTPFLKRAAARGARTLDGLGMLANQGAINFELWTGRKAPRDVMVAQLKAEFGLE